MATGGGSANNLANNNENESSSDSGGTELEQAQATANSENACYKSFSAKFNNSLENESVQLGNLPFILFFT